jgi:hypothetical protein
VAIQPPGNRSLCTFRDTAETVPFQNLICATSFRTLASVGWPVALRSRSILLLDHLAALVEHLLHRIDAILET